MKHTKGPWNVQAIGPDTKHLDEGGLFQLTGPEGESPMMDELKGNARLIAAAPELLEACKTAIDYLTDFGIEKNEYIWEPLLKAIAKAEGKE